MTPPLLDSASTLSAPSLREFAPLTVAETILVDAISAGSIAKIGYQRPPSAGSDVLIRADLLRLLVLGEGRSGAEPTRRIELTGARIVGRLDLAGMRVPRSLWFYRCVFDASPCLDHARVIGHLSFADCALPGLSGEDSHVEGDLALHAGCTVTGEVRLARAVIGGDLDASGLRLRSAEAPAQRLRRVFVADGMVVGGDVKLLGGVDIVGETRCIGARVGGSLRASGARLVADIDEDGARGVALNLDRIRVGASVMLDAGFSTIGQVRLRQARIGADLDASSAEFDAVGDASWGEEGGALLLDRACIDGTLNLSQLRSPLQGASLADARAGTLADDSSTWGQQHVLDGFVYRRFGAASPCDAAMRLEWLARQHAAHVDGDFRTGPWRQVIRTLRAAGHIANADAVTIGREQSMRRAGRIGLGLPARWRRAAEVAHGAWGLFAGHGRRPSRLVATAALVWLLCGAAYWSGSERGGFVPAAALVAADARLAACAPACSLLPAGVPLFQPFLYSLDVLLPLTDLRQTRHWAPARGAAASPQGPAGLPLLEWLGVLETLGGWLIAAALVLCATGRTERDRHA